MKGTGLSEGFCLRVCRDCHNAIRRKNRKRRGVEISEFQFGIFNITRSVSSERKTIRLSYKVRLDYKVSKKYRIRFPKEDNPKKMKNKWREEFKRKKNTLSYAKRQMARGCTVMSPVDIPDSLAQVYLDNLKLKRIIEDQQCKT